MSMSMFTVFLKHTRQARVLRVHLRVRRMHNVEQPQKRTLMTMFGEVRFGDDHHKK